MKNRRGQKLILIFIAIVLIATGLRAQVFDQIGLTALRSVTTNLDGRGIRVAQPEAAVGPGAFEVDPAAVSQPVSLFTYFSAAGTATNFPNSVGTVSDHARDVGNTFYSPVIFGVATNVAHVDNYDANFFITNYVVNVVAMPAASVVNQSFTYGPLDAANQTPLDTIFDDYSSAFGTIFVSAACNADLSVSVCAPGTAYNCISVGAYANSTYYNSIGPTVDNGRCKPDITAIAGATSYSTPQVSAAVALLTQAGLRGDGGPYTNFAVNLRTIKALLLNGAVKPVGWANGPSKPLDARSGSGVLNILNSYKQLTGGKQSNIVSTTTGSLNATHPPTSDTASVPVLSGWDFSTNTSSATSDAIKHYYFDVTNSLTGAKFTFTTTLVWNRHQNKTSINNLNLFLYNCANSNLVACSTSLVDNVEHIYKTNLAQGRYDLQVWKAGGTTVSTNEIYALAFEFFTDTLSISQSGTNTTLMWPVYPAGFLVETTTNLTSPNWTTNNLAASLITNNLNTLPLNATNANQFFRLRRPNF